MTCDIDGVVIRPLTKFHDERGWLEELFRRDEIPGEFYPAMSYISMTKAGVTRGPHEHRHQSDMFCFVGPATFRVYLWDNRKTSTTFGKKCVMEFGEDNNALLIVPAGVVHAYRNISQIDGLTINAPNRLYAGEDRRQSVDEIRYEDDPDSPFRISD